MRSCVQIFCLLVMITPSLSGNQTADTRERNRHRLTVDVVHEINAGGWLMGPRDSTEVTITPQGQPMARRLGTLVMGAIPSGEGLLRITGEPDSCVRLWAESLREGDGLGLRVRRIFLETEGHSAEDEIEIHLNERGVAEVAVGVELRLSSHAPMGNWRLGLSFAAEYLPDCH